MNRPDRWHADLTVSEVRAVLHYEPITGVFTWIAGRSDKIGREAASPATLGYRTITFRKKHYRRGRLAWLYMTGAWPAGEIDHMNGVPDDDRWENLRVVTRRQNEWNKPRRANRSGYKGVTWLNRRSPKKWRAVIRTNGKRIVVGYFADPADAGRAYADAERRLFGEGANRRGDHALPERHQDSRARPEREPREGDGDAV